MEASESRSPAPRGGLERAALEALIEEGLTVRQMAARLDRSATTVRYWLPAYGIALNRKPGRRPRDIVGITENGGLVAACPVHGSTEHGIDGRGHLRCLQCRIEAVARRRRKVKEILVREAGGCCAICGYNRCMAALEFHHVNPAEKAFHVSRNGVTRSLARARAEARKCALLCSNCHVAVQMGLQAVPLH